VTERAVERRIEIRWRDLDAYGHVNNAVFLSYLEEARDAWVQAALGPAADAWDFVLARVAVDFKRELTLDDRAVLVRCRLGSVGRSSVHTREEVVTLDGVVSAVSESVIVPRDPRSGRSRPLSEEERAALEGSRNEPP
jgi:acyl-CoA thioester hydrolase